MNELLEAARELLPTAAATAVSALLLGLAHWVLLGRNRAANGESRVPRQLLMLVLTGVAVITVILTLPIGESTRNQLLGLLGLGLTAVIGLSSTSFVSNAMAGLMLRLVGSFRAGDFIRVDDHFGRVTELGILHTEIQTEDRDLTTLPNLFVVTNPVRVVRSSGTIISSELSLGYDLDHAHIEPLLAAAARATGLEDPFVQVLSLGDHSVVYRVAGFLRDPRQLLSTRSNLQRNVLDTLHRAGIEIVSPNFMNQRVLDAEARMVPAVGFRPAARADTKRGPEELVFDKAEAAERLGRLQRAQSAVKTEIERLEGENGKSEGNSSDHARVRELARRRAELRAIEDAIAVEESRRED